MSHSPVDCTGDTERTPLGVLREVFGFESFRGQQLAIIEHVITGGNAVVLMPTGGGKIAVLSGIGAAAPRFRRRCLAVDRVDEGPS